MSDELQLPEEQQLQTTEEAVEQARAIHRRVNLMANISGWSGAIITVASFFSIGYFGGWSWGFFLGSMVITFGLQYFFRHRKKVLDKKINAAKEMAVNTFAQDFLPTGRYSAGVEEAEARVLETGLLPKIWDSGQITDEFKGTWENVNYDIFRALMIGPVVKDDAPKTIFDGIIAGFKLKDDFKGSHLYVHEDWGKLIAVEKGSYRAMPFFESKGRQAINVNPNQIPVKFKLFSNHLPEANNLIENKIHQAAEKIWEMFNVLPVFHFNGDMVWVALDLKEDYFDIIEKKDPDLKNKIRARLKSVLNIYFILEPVLKKA